MCVRESFRILNPRPSFPLAGAAVGHAVAARGHETRGPEGLCLLPPLRPSAGVWGVGLYSLLGTQNSESITTRNLVEWSVDKVACEGAGLRFRG